MSREKKQSFMGGVTVMAISTVFVKICGALYKIPLNNILGEEGVTHFMSAYNIYTFLLTLSTTGLPLALSKLISEAHATGRRTQMRRCFNTAMALFAAMGAAGTAVMLLFTRQLAELLNNPSAYWPIKTLGVSVICVSIMCAYRGFAQGRQNMVPTAVSQFIEAFFKLLVGLPLAWYLIRMGQPLEIGAAGAIVGVSAGIVLAMLYMVLNYRRHRGPILWGTDVPQSHGAIIRRLLGLGIPITIGQAGMSLLNMVDQSVILGRLQEVLGYTEQASAALYGQYSFSNTLFNLPAAFLPAVSVSLSRRCPWRWCGKTTRRSTRSSPPASGSSPCWPSRRGWGSRCWRSRSCSCCTPRGGRRPSPPPTTSKFWARRPSLCASCS